MQFLGWNLVAFRGTKEVERHFPRALDVPGDSEHTPDRQGFVSLLSRCVYQGCLAWALGKMDSQPRNPLLSSALSPQRWKGVQSPETGSV